MVKQVVTKRLPGKKLLADDMNQQCSVIATLKLFATKWKPCIICYLALRPMRYNDLFRIIPNISRKMLSEHLKELESSQLVVRVPFDKKLQRVEYELSPKGHSLMPLLTQLQDWGMSNLSNVLTMQQMLDMYMK